MKFCLQVPSSSPPICLAWIGCLSLEESITPTISSWPEPCVAKAKNMQRQQIYQVLK